MQGDWCMKDLKHIHYYEKHLEETANELVLQEREAGGIARHKSVLHVEFYLRLYAGSF